MRVRSLVPRPSVRNARAQFAHGGGRRPGNEATRACVVTPLHGQFFCFRLPCLFRYIAIIFYCAYIYTKKAHNTAFISALLE